MSIADLTSARKAEIFFTALLALLVCALFACTPPSQGGQSSVSAATSSATSSQVAKQDADDAQIIDAVVDNFTLLANTPDPRTMKSWSALSSWTGRKSRGFRPYRTALLMSCSKYPPPPGETLYLNSIPKTWRLLEGVLAEVN